MNKHSLSLIFTILASCILTCNIFAARPLKLEKALKTLDEAIGQMEGKRLARLGEIDSLYDQHQATLVPDPQSLLNVGRQYIGFNKDSAVNILQRAITSANLAGDSATLRDAKIDYASVLPKFGIYTDAIALMDHINVDSLTENQKFKYFSTMSGILLNAATYPPFRYHSDEYNARALVYLDSLRERLNPDGLGYRTTTAQIDLLNGEEALAFSELNEALEHADISDPGYAIVTNMIAKYLRDKPERADEYLYYLTLSATADAINVNSDAESLLRLGNELFERGDHEHAFKYLTSAGKFMAESGERSYIIELTSPISIYTEIINKRETGRTLIIILIALISIITLGLIYWYAHNAVTKARMQAAKYEKIAASVNSRDQYITELLNLCAVYVESMEDYNKLISRKLKTNQTQDLLKTVESGKIMQDQTDKFFTVFDDAISKIYPDFIDELNSLFLPDKLLAMPASGRLLPEMRIAAFMRLGVTDSSRLSKFLGLSLNTIYTYRNRLKSRAVNRDSFEQDLQNLGSNDD